MDVTIRAARRRDAGAIAGLMRDFAATQDRPTGLVTTTTVTRDVLGPGRVVTTHVAEAGGRPVGYVCFQPAYESAYAARGLYVCDLYVDAAMRRRGIARRLLASVAREAKALGLTYVWWVSIAGNDTAHRLYRSIANIEEPLIAHAVADEAFERLASLDQPA